MTKINIDDIEILTIDTICVNKECEEVGFHVSLTLHDRGEWKRHKGYPDPKKGFKEPKIFATRVMEWYGECGNCGREYEASFRIKLGE